MNPEKVIKKSDVDLWNLVHQKIITVHYVFLNHAKTRLLDRKITDIEVLDILDHKNKWKRNKSKDTYMPGFPDWKYCIEGKALRDEPNLRVIISFDKDYLLVITVIRLEMEERII